MANADSLSRPLITRNVRLAPLCLAHLGNSLARESNGSVMVAGGQLAMGHLADDGGKLGLAGIGDDDVALPAIAPIAHAYTPDLRDVQAIDLSVIARRQANGQPVSLPILIDQSGQRMRHVAHHPPADQLETDRSQFRYFDLLTQSRRHPASQIAAPLTGVDG